MIESIITCWNASSDLVRARLSKMGGYVSYESLLKITLEEIGGELSEGERYEYPSPDKITKVDNGEYQGTLIFIVGAGSYQPTVSQHFYTSVYYGSCSHCDTLSAILDNEERTEFFSEDQVQQLWTLCLHMIQRMKRLGE